MTRYRLSRKAAEDILEIGRFTQRRWGVARRRAYLADLEASLVLLAGNPYLGVDRSDARADFRSHPIGRHVIFYKPMPHGIDVVRILHAAMEARRHLTGRVAFDNDS